MPAAVLSVGPMPEPVSRYQVPLAAATSTPASSHSASSALWVPLSSPREANGALAAAIFAERRDGVLAALDAGRIGRGPDDHEVVVHDLVALDPEAVGDELLLGRLVVHEQHVGIAVLGELDRLAGADRDHPHLDAGLLR